MRDWSNIRESDRKVPFVKFVQGIYQSGLPLPVISIALENLMVAKTLALFAAEDYKQKCFEYYQTFPFPSDKVPVGVSTPLLRFYSTSPMWVIEYSEVIDEKQDEAVLTYSYDKVLEALNDGDFQDFLDSTD